MSNIKFLFQRPYLCMSSLSLLYNLRPRHKTSLWQGDGKVQGKGYMECERVLSIQRCKHAGGGGDTTKGYRPEPAVGPASRPDAHHCADDAMLINASSERKCGLSSVVCNDKRVPCIVSFLETGILGNGIDQNCCLGHKKLDCPANSACVGGGHILRVLTLNKTK